MNIQVLLIIPDYRVLSPNTYISTLYHVQNITNSYLLFLKIDGALHTSHIATVTGIIYCFHISNLRHSLIITIEYINNVKLLQIMRKNLIKKEM